MAEEMTEHFPPGGTGAFPDRVAIASHQLTQLRALLRTIVPANKFHSRRLGNSGNGSAIESLEQFSQTVPLCSKLDIAEDQKTNPPYGTNLTFPIGGYTRFSQTSGTTGTPIRWLDTPDGWNAMVDRWVEVFRAAGVTEHDHVVFAFSFGPFLGFWLAFEAAQRIGCLCIPGGGLGSTTRLRVIIDNAATVLCCTPTYAARLAEVAAEERIDLRASRVKTLMVAGEAGGSIPATRARLSQLWIGARIFDHHGMTEVGPVTFECPAKPGRLHVMESAFYAEVVNPASGKPVDAGDSGELILTTLHRTGSPVLRYRTGDLVRPVSLTSPCACGRHTLALEGGILGRTDDMVIVRGVNIYPAAVEDVIRSNGDVMEYQVTTHQTDSLFRVALKVEPDAGCKDPDALARRLEKAFQDAFSLHVPVTTVPVGTLPRSEMKARRWVRGS